MSVFDITPEVKESAEDKNTLVEFFKYAALHPGETKSIIDTVVGSIGSVAAPIISRFMPNAAPPQQPAQTGASNFSLDSLRMLRGEQPPAQTTKTQPQPTQTTKTQASQSAKVSLKSDIPFIALED